MVSACCLQIRNTVIVSYRQDVPLRPERKTAHITNTVFVMYLGSMVAACLSLVRNIVILSALTLLVERQERHGLLKICHNS